MIRDIALHLPCRASDTPAIDYAVSVAARFEAHIAGIAFALEPFVPPTTGMGEAIPFEWIDAQREEARKAADAAIARFDDAARRNSVFAETRTIETSIGGAATLFGQLARRFDMSIVRQAEPRKPPFEELIIEAALFDSGRPVLVVPYIQRGSLKLDRVMICWDGSRNAARAVADAMPFLRKAKAVEVVIVLRADRKDDEIPGTDIAEHLARHDLRVAIERIVAPDGDIADTILSHAADAGTDFLVMGGYGHSRLREFVLGGVTRGILTSMTVPALMSH